MSSFAEPRSRRGETPPSPEGVPLRPETAKAEFKPDAARSMIRARVRDAQTKSLHSDICHCQEITKAVHGEHHKGPRLRSVDHLELQQSRLYEGPLSKLGLWLLDVYDDLRDAWQRLSRALWPRSLIVVGKPLETSCVTGRLSFGQKMCDDMLPIHHMHVELWGRALWGSWYRFGEDLTNEDGAFRIPYDLTWVQRWWMRKVVLEIYHTGEHRFVDGEPTNRYQLFHKVPIEKKWLFGLDFDLGTTQLFYWEYRLDTPIPRVTIHDHDRDAPESYSQGRLDAIERQFVPIELIKVRHLERLKKHPGSLDVPTIQKDYPLNLTQCVEAEQPGMTRGDEWFGERMMNGMYASDFDRDPDNPERLWVHYHWGSYDQTVGEHAMPDVDMYFELEDNGLPMPVEIRLVGPLNRHELGERPRRVFTPEDGEQWLAAKRVARVSGALYTEIVHHFVITHLNVEQFALAARRNLRLSPLTILLFPHLKEASLVDSTADRILVGNGYISQATALTAKGIDQLSYQTLGTCDWRGWQPPAPISDAHAYAKAASLYWSVLLRYVEDFIDSNRGGIARHWHEVFRFSEELSHRSVPAFLCKYLRKALLEADGSAKADKDAAWYRRDNRMDLHFERPIWQGEPRAMSYITRARVAADVSEQDWQHLRDACAYAIFQATFGHTWANSKQYDDIGEVLYACLGLRYGDSRDGVLGPEADLSIAPSPEHATQMMWWSNMLSRTSYGFIMSNEDGDISPSLLEALEAERGRFAECGLSIDDLQSRINI